MSRSSRFLRVAAPAVLVLAAVTGCAQDGRPAADPPAATVNGSEIAMDTLMATVDELGGAAATDTSVGMAETTSLLTLLIQLEAAEEQLADDGVAVTPELEDQARQLLIEDLGRDQTTGAVDPAAGEAAFEELGDAEREFNLRLATVLVTLASTLSDEETGAAPVTDEQVRASYDEALLTTYTTRCARGIFVDPAEPDQTAVGEEIAAAMASGEFDAVLEEYSPDPANPNGGDFGCVAQPDITEPAVSAAVFDSEVGEIVGPITTSAGTVVIEVYDEQVVPFEEAEPQIRAGLEDANVSARLGAAQALMGSIALDADVEVDPRFGTWGYTDEAGLPVDDAADAAAAAVIPPAGPAEAPAGTDDTVVDPSTGLPTGTEGGGAPVAP